AGIQSRPPSEPRQLAVRVSVVVMKGPESALRPLQRKGCLWRRLPARVTPGPPADQELNQPSTLTARFTGEAPALKIETEALELKPETARLVVEAPGCVLNA